MDDLKIIKKKYGEQMMKYCRSSFPTILETKGLLSTFMLDHFEPNRFLYNDLLVDEKLDDFQKYIYANLLNKNELIIENIESPKELLNKINYKLIECKTDEEVKEFKKYYKTEEKLCTFNDASRIKRCHVFFLLKNNIEEIKREQFINPKREDEYATSILSIQFTRDESHILSIKNRYNHTVPNPDNTYNNNLDNIIPGLSYSFYKYYNLKETINKIDLKIRNYKIVNNKYYKYNYFFSSNGKAIYICPNNTIIINNEIIKYDKEKYIIMDYFLLDLVNKKINLIENIEQNDTFYKSINNINKIEVINQNEEKLIFITTKENTIKIKLNNLGKVINYENNKLEILDNFLEKNKELEEIKVENLKEIKEYALRYKNIKKLIIPEGIKTIPKNAFYYSNIEELILPNSLEKISEYAFMGNKIKNIILPKNLKTIGANAFASNNIETLILPDNLKYIGPSAFSNNKIKELTINNNLNTIEESCFKNNQIEYLEIPSNIKTILQDAFNNNPMYELYLEDTINIDRYAFLNTKLFEVTIPDNSIINQMVFPRETKIINKKTK